jgi:hypothetical protein
MPAFAGMTAWPADSPARPIVLRQSGLGANQSRIEIAVGIRGFLPAYASFWMRARAAAGLRTLAPEMK